MRERRGAPDQTSEEAFRRENYEKFKKNLEDAFDKFNIDKDAFLSRDEFF